LKPLWVAGFTPGQCWTAKDKIYNFFSGEKYQRPVDEGSL
jgi:hypothetical protein